MRILKKSLNITFTNPNTEEQIVQAIAGVLAYNLAENDNMIIFNYNSNSYQNSHSIEDEELEMWAKHRKNIDFLQHKEFALN